MALETDAIVDVDYVLQHGDPRVEKYPLMQSPLQPLGICMAYVIFVKVIGPLWMRKRKPYELKFSMIIYNLSMVVINIWMFYRLSYYGWFNDFSWLCEPIDYSRSEKAIKILEVCYVYYISKFIEFLDTAFMVLRKKDSQVTFLHVFHHFSMAIWCFYFVKYSGGGYATIIPFLNSFVHTFMYAYYGLAACGHSIQKYLWWKQYLTDLQFVQFVLTMLFGIQIRIVPAPNCKVTNYQAFMTFIPGIVFFILFIPFYRSLYSNKKKK